MYFHIVYFRCIIPDLWLSMRRRYTQCQPQKKEVMLSTALGFPIGKKVTDHCSNLVPETVGFPQELLPP